MTEEFDFLNMDDLNQTQTLTPRLMMMRLMMELKMLSWLDWSWSLPWWCFL
jgi:hypothetical protein